MTIQAVNGAPQPHPDAVQLDAAWDALIRDQTPIPVDGELFDLIQRLHHGAPVGTPDARFTATLKETLMSTAMTMTTADTMRALPTTRPHVVPHDARHNLGLSRLLPALLSAAMLLLTLGLATWALWPASEADPDRPGGPAIVAPGTPATETETGSSLVEFPLPAESLPPDGIADMGLRYFTMAPGTTAAWIASPAGASPGVWANYIVAGRVTVTAGGDVTVIRDDGAQQTILAGTVVTLDVGDSAIHNTMDSASWISGPEQVDILSLYLQDSPYLQYPTPVGWTQVRINVDFPVDVPASETVLRLQQVELEPDGEIPAPGESALQVAITGPNSDAHLARTGTEGAFTLNGADEVTTAYVFILVGTGSEPATPAATP